MTEIVQNLFIGNGVDCDKNFNTMPTIHACKTCHQKALNYRKSLSANHPNYLIYRNNMHLFLNMVDMPNEFLAKFTHPMIKESLLFIKSYILQKPVLIHCNQGYSRSPSIGLIYLAIDNKINNTSYDLAKKDFSNIYPDFQPGNGIELYMQNNWLELLQL